MGGNVLLPNCFAPQRMVQQLVVKYAVKLHTTRNAAKELKTHFRACGEEKYPQVTIAYQCGAKAPATYSVACGETCRAVSSHVLRKAATRLRRVLRMHMLDFATSVALAQQHCA